MRLDVVLAVQRQDATTSVQISDSHSKFKMFMKKNSGFTLIEVLVVVAIIAIMMALLIPNVLGIRDRAADAKLKSKLNSFKSALQMYYNDKGVYPDTGGTANAIAITGASSKYMKDTMSELKYYNVMLADTVVACVYLQNTGDMDISQSQSNCFSGPPDASQATELQNANCPLTNCFCVCTL